MYRQAVTVRWTGATDFESALPSGSVVMMNDVGPKPVETLVACLGACSGLTLQTVLEKMRLRFDGMEIEIDAELTDKSPRQLLKVSLVYRLRGKDLNPEQVARAVRLADDNCSVHLILGKACPIVTSFEIVEG